MPNIILINNPEEILNHSHGFQDAIKFKSKDRLVKEEGKPFSFKYTGWRYRIIDKKTRDFTFLELTARKVFGVVLIVFTSGIILISEHSKYVHKLFTKKCKNIRFALKESRINSTGELESSFDQKEILKSEQQLKGNLGNFTNAANWIQRNKWNIVNHTEIAGIKHHKIKGDNYIFELDTAPGFVFKMANNDKDTESRYKNMILAETVVRTHNLGLLIIPRSKHIKQKGVNFIVEEKLKFIPHDPTQKALFHRNDNTLREVVRQLAIFICKTGYDDVEWRNNPILIDNDNKADKKIGLIDVELMEEPAMGLFGNTDLKRTGLIGCTPIVYHEMIREIARDYRIGYVGDDIYYQSIAKKITGGHSYIEATRIKDKILLEDKIKPKPLDRLAKWHIDRNIHIGDEATLYKLQPQDFLLPEDGMNYVLCALRHSIASQVIELANGIFANSCPYPLLRVITINTKKVINEFDNTLEILLKNDIIFTFKTIIKDQHYEIQF